MNWRVIGRQDGQRLGLERLRRGFSGRWAGRSVSRLTTWRRDAWRFGSRRTGSFGDGLRGDDRRAGRRARPALLRGLTTAVDLAQKPGQVGKRVLLPAARTLSPLAPLGRGPRFLSPF